MLTRIFIILFTAFVSLNCIRAGYYSIQDGDIGSAVIMFTIGMASICIPVILTEKPDKT